LARKLFSFLGTGKYEPCYYYLIVGDEKINDNNYRCYIQESLTNLLAKTNRQLDEIVMFITDEAWKANWIKNNNEKYDLPGLKDTLSRYKGECTVTPVRIPSGESEQELWQIFDRMFDQVDPKDEIIFDITHSFRSIPIVATIILNYAKFVKGCDIGGIYYGAVEALCPPWELKNLPIEVRYCPIFSLTSFVELLDWTVGIDKFISTGDARQVASLIDIERERFGRLGEYDKANFFKYLETSIYSYTNSIATCRGRELSKTALDLKSKLEEITDSPELVHIKPIKPLLEKMGKELRTYINNEHKNMLKAVRWCCEHNLIQQGITILQEGVVTFLCERYGLDQNNVITNRTVINQVAAIKKQNYLRSAELPVKKWSKKSRENKQLVRQLLDDEYFKKAAQLLNSMMDTRNDINHAGWRKTPFEPKTIENNLDKFLKEAEQLIEEGLSN
jgi:CRISPR-associated Csx2 family protein